MALTMLCDICEEPCTDGYHLVSVTKASAPLASAFLGLSTPTRAAVCRRCGKSTTIAQLAQMIRGAAFVDDAEAATV